MKMTYDIYFDDDNCTNNKGWKESYRYCKDYIKMSILEKSLDFFYADAGHCWACAESLSM